MSNTILDKIHADSEPTDVACLDVISGIAKQLGIDDISNTIQGKEREAISLTRELHRDLMRLLGAEAGDQVEPVVSPLPNFTDRELEVLKWAVAGKSDAVTAQILGVSEKVVRHAWSNLFKKLQCSHKVQCIVVATKIGLIA